jgi:hypothetical protein
MALMDGSTPGLCDTIFLEVRMSLLFSLWDGWV